MKNLFRCISILLIICMLIGNTVSASAADSTEKESQKTWNVTISTLDSDGSRIAGVTLTVKPGADGIADKTLTTTADSAASINLTQGSYTISETTVPDGYEKAADVAFTLDAEGNAAIQEESGTTEAAGRQITIVNPKPPRKKQTRARAMTRCPLQSRLRVRQLHKARQLYKANHWTYHRTALHR